MLLLSLFVFWHSSKFGIVEIDAIYINLRVIYEFGTSLGILWVAILKYSEFKARASHLDVILRSAGQAQESRQSFPV